MSHSVPDALAALARLLICAVAAALVVGTVPVAAQELAPAAPAQTPVPTVQPQPDSQPQVPAAPLALPPVPNDDPWFGAVQAIHAPQRAYDAGVYWQRLIFPWEEIQPGSARDFRQAWFSDADIDAQRALGFEVIGITLYTPRWAARDPQFGARSVPRNLHLPIDHPDNYWAAYVKRLAAHYRGRIDTWVFYNEPDLYSDDQGFRTFAGTPADYALLLKTGYLAAKSVDPNVKIVMAGLTYWWDKEYNRPQYFQRVLDALGGDSTATRNNWFFDVVDVHAYGNPLNSFAQPQVFRRIMRQKGIDKPIWITESNVLVKNDPLVPAGDGPYRATMDEQASYVIQSMALALAAGVRRYSIYKMQDEFPENGDEYFGLTRNDGTVRPSYLAYQTAVRYLQGAQKATYSWEEVTIPPTEEEISVLLASNATRYQWPWPAPVNAVMVERATDRVTVVWNASPEPVEFALPATRSTAQVVDKYGRSGRVNARNGLYWMSLEPSRNNSDPRDPTLYLVGGSPLLIIEDLAEPANAS